MGGHSLWCENTSGSGKNFAGSEKQKRPISGLVNLAKSADYPALYVQDATTPSLGFLDPYDSVDSAAPDRLSQG